MKYAIIGITSDKISPFMIRIYTANKLNMKLILFLALVCRACADYDCLCNYNVEKSVFQSQSASSTELGYLYEFDCKQIIEQAQQLLAGWKTIAFEHQVGYVEKDDQTTTQICSGDPPVADIVSMPTSPPLQTSSQNIENTAITIEPNTETSQEQATTVAATINATPSVKIAVASSPLSTATVSTATYITTTYYFAPTSSNNSAHICPQAVYNATMSDNATLIINQAERKCYEFVQSHKTWSVAEDSCQKNGGHLVTVRNVNESNELYEYVKAYGHSTWLGLNDKNDEGNFTWVSGEVSSYTNWRSGHTNFFIHGSEDCVCMLSSSGRWEDLSCSSSYAYICEYASIPDVSGNSGTQAPLGSDGSIHLCPISFIFAERTDKNIILGQYGDSCYVLTNSSKVTWTSAESTCKHNGGHLAHIRNADEQNFIEEFMNRHASQLATWIGLRDTVHEGQFQWSSGEAVTYTNWVPGFNGTHHSSEDCVVLLPNQTGKWDEVYCGYHGSFFNSQTERHQMLCQYKNEAHVSSILIG